MKTYTLDALFMFSHSLAYKDVNILIFFRNSHSNELDSNVDILMSIECI